MSLFWRILAVVWAVLAATVAGSVWLTLTISGSGPSGPGDGFRPPELPLVRVAVALMASAALSSWLAHRLAAPLARLRDAVRRIAEGDLSARVPAEAAGPGRDEVRALGADFNRMADRIELLVRAQRDLLRDVSHELRSPLARVQVALGLLQQSAGGLPSGPIERIERELEQLGALVSELLALARLETPSSLVTAAEVDVSILLEGVGEDAVFEAEARRVRVACEAKPALAVSGDAVLLARAIENLARNAIVHAPVDSTVELAAERAGEGVVVAVRDRGPGVPESQLARIFEPFVRDVGDVRGESRGGSGLGLGLAIASRAIELHGGTIRAQNRDGGGLEVIVRLPAARRSRTARRPG